MRCCIGVDDGVDGVELYLITNLCRVSLRSWGADGALQLLKLLHFVLSLLLLSLLAILTRQAEMRLGG